MNERLEVCNQFRREGNVMIVLCELQKFSHLARFDRFLELLFVVQSGLNYEETIF